MTIGILYIALGKYTVFWDEFYKTTEELFIPCARKKYYVFSDKPDLITRADDNVVVIYQEDLGWPKDTLLRFEMFMRISERLRDETDYLFFFNANLLPLKEISESFLPQERDLLVALHPGYYNINNPDRYPYCRDAHSRAYVPYGQGSIYVQGALNGGKTEDYLNMVGELARNTAEDLNDGIIATVHDESHLNRYIIGRRDIKVVGPEYIYPEGWMLDGIEPIILSRDKAKYFDVDKIKLAKRRYVFRKIKARIKDILLR